MEVRQLPGTRRFLTRFDPDDRSVVAQAFEKGATTAASPAAVVAEVRRLAGAWMSHPSRSGAAARLLEALQSDPRGALEFAEHHLARQRREGSS